MRRGLSGRLSAAEEAAALGDPWGAQPLAVEFQPIPGFCAVSFRCDHAEVAAAESTLAAT